METPVKAPKERDKNQKTCEASTEDRDFLGLISGDQHGRIQAVFVPCHMSMMKTERDIDSHRDEYCKVIPPQPFSRLLLLKSTHACSILMLDELVHILRQGAYRRVNFRCGSCEGHRMVAFVELSSSGPRLRQIGVQGMPLHRLANEFMNFHVFCRQLGGILYLNGPPAAAAATRSVAANDRKREVDWSSLPVLPLLKIMDRLDVFDNRRLTAVCRDWWSVSVRYPQNLYSVGDGEPWICHMKYGGESHTWEFISVSKNRKFEVDMPEFARSRVLFSKGGWILLQNGGFVSRELASWFLVNPFTRDKIKLPNRDGGNYARCCGLFKLGNDGRPDRVYLIIPEVPYQARINTTRPGDKEWTSHNYTGLDRTFLTLFTHVAIGDMVYCKDPGSYITVFNLADNSVKVLPPVSSAGFITEHEGELFYVVRQKVGSKKGTKPRIVVRKYHDASSSWEKLKHNPVMGTSWYWCDFRSSIISAAEGSGTKIYRLRQKVELTRSGWGCEYSYYYVSVRDLVTGKLRKLRVPFHNHRCPFWVAIG